jgi:hypothetical protein
MASTYVNDLRLNEMATGDESGNWGVVTNLNLELIGEALSFGTEAITTNADTHTTTVADGAADPGRAMYLKYTGTLDSACTITIAPNTISRMQFIENGTSGSQNIIISQGSGANITIPAGDTKAVYLDGAGSGAAVVDAFASLSTVDLKVQDDLTVTDDASVGGDLLVSGEVQTANIGFTDGDNALTISDGGSVSFAAGVTLAGTTPTLTIGDAGAEDTKIVFDGNAQDFYIALDDSADDLLVGLGSTVGTTPIISITEAGAVTLKNVGTGDDNPMSLTLQTSETDIAANDVLGKISFQAPDEGAGTDAILVAAAIQAISEGDFSSSSNATSLSFMTGASEAATSKMTLSSGGVLDVDGGITVDNITIDGTEIDLSSGDLTIDVAGDIILDADDGTISLKDGGTQFGFLAKGGSDKLSIKATIQDADIAFFGNDGGSEVTALTLDMSDAGRAIFPTGVLIHDTSALTNTTFDARDVDNVTSLNVQNNAATIQRSQSATAAPTLVFNKARGSLGSEANTNNGDFLGSINFRGYHTNGFYSGATIEAKISGTHGTSDMPSDLIFSVSPDGSSTPVEAFGIKTDDTCHVGVTTNGARLGGAKLNVFQSSTSVYAINVRTGRASGDVGRAISFHENANEFGNEVGAINTNGSSTIYATSSDYRLKENVDYTWDATTRLKQLKPARFNFIADDTNTLVDGFLAHEVSSVIPEAIVGAKDAVDADGNINGQLIDQSKLTPLLTKALLELEARVTTLEG